MFYLKKICILLLLPRCFTLLIPRYVTPLINGTDRYTTTTPGPDDEKAAVQKELLNYNKYINEIPDNIKRAELRVELRHLIQRAMKAEKETKKLLDDKGMIMEEKGREEGILKTLLNNETRALKEICKPIAIFQKIRNKIENYAVYGGGAAKYFTERYDFIIKAIANLRNKRPFSLFNAIKVFCFYADDANRKNVPNHNEVLQYAYKELKSLNLHVDEECKKTYTTFDEELLEKIETLSNTSNFDDLLSKWSSDMQYWREKKRIWGVKNTIEENCYPNEMDKKEKDTFELISDSLLCVKDILGQLKLKSPEEYDFASIQLSQPKSYPIGIKEDPSTYKSCLWTFCHSTQSYYPHYQTALNIFKNISKTSSDDELSTISKFCIGMAALSRLSSMQFFPEKDRALYKKIPIERKDVDMFIKEVSKEDQSLKAVLYSLAYLAALIDAD